MKQLIGYSDKHKGFVVHIAHEGDERPSLSPGVFRMNKQGAYLLEDTKSVANYLCGQYNRNQFSATAQSRLLYYKMQSAKKTEGFPKWYKFKHPPMDRQWDAMTMMWNQQEMALFMEVGTGKTFVTINVNVARAMAGKINSMLVLCPTSVKPVWEIEMEKHCPIPHNVHVLESGGKAAFERFLQRDEKSEFKVLVVGIEALSQGSAYDQAVDFVLNHNAAIALDESSRIKNYKAERTKRALKLAAAVMYRAILTGTPVTQGMHDLYSQMAFLSPSILGQKSYFTFKARYCIMGGFEGRQILGYTNQEELIDRIAPYAIMIKKEEMLDLPDKIYEQRFVEQTVAQQKALTDLGDPFLMATAVDDKILEVETILERMTRYQQIVGGHFPFDQEDGTHGIIPFPGKNPKLEELKAIIEDLPNDVKVIVWARFIPEIALIQEALEPHGGVVTYTGATPSDQRKQVLIDFQENPAIRFFVSNPSMGGLGITLTAATVAIYYSNTFSLEDRIQTEGRPHRKGQTNNVTYIDLIMNHKIDKAIVTALRRKKSIADYVDERLMEDR